RNALKLFTRRLGANLNPAGERIVFVKQRQVRAAATEEFREHFTEVGSHLRKGFAEQLSRSRVDLRNYIEQLAARICKVIILFFEKLVPLLQFIVLMNGIKVHRAHIVELARKILDELFEV